MKKLLSLIFCITFLLAFSPAVLAASVSVLDEAEILSPREEALLTEQAQQIMETHDLSVVILLVDSLDGSTTWKYADTHFYSGNYGKDGILLLLSVEYRDWEIATYGETAERISDRQCDGLFDSMADALSRNDFYEGIEDYFYALNGVLSRKSYGQNIFLQIVVSVLIGAVVALITILIMRNKMNSVRPQHSAANYLIQRSYRLTEKRDIYLYSNVTKIRRSQNSSSGGGGGGGRGGSRGKF